MTINELYFCLCQYNCVGMCCKNTREGAIMEHGYPTKIKKEEYYRKAESKAIDCLARKGKNWRFRIMKVKKIYILILAICMLTFSACKNDSADSVSSPSSAQFGDYVSSAGSGGDSSSPDSSDYASSASDSGSGSPSNGPQSSGSNSQQKNSSQAGTADSTSSAKDPGVKPRETARVTVPEGETFMQIATRLEKAGVCSKSAFYKAAQNYTVQSFTIPGSPNRCFKMEGYLFPDTYEFYKDDNPVDVLRKMLNNYAAKSGMPSDETLILASIVEKEARSGEHMKMVASVFRNRLKAGMKLEADPTRAYVNANITGNSLVADPGKYAALYNTYKCAALPAGPICNPGAKAIAAAKKPAASNYLYFFFGNDNTNHYSTTLEEHEAQMKQYGVQYGM